MELNLRYVRLINDVPVNYSIEQLLLDFPDAQIYKHSKLLPNEELLKNYNVYPLITTPKPTDINLIVEEDSPRLINGEWHQTWKTRPATEEELAELNRPTTTSSSTTT